MNIFFDTASLVAADMAVWIYVFAFLLGICFGSFANVFIYRSPIGKSILNPPSFCPKCNKKLKPIDLIPILSWLVLRGKCRFCKNKISFQYPLVELICGLLFLSAALYTFSLSAVFISIFLLILLIITAIDIKTQEISDKILIFLGITGLLWILGGQIAPQVFPQAPIWQDALFGVLAGGLPLIIIDRICILILKKDGFGYGDSKLMAAAGLFLGWQIILLAFLFAFALGALFAIPLIIFKKVGRQSYIAFAPFLSAGIFASMWLGERFLNIILP